MNTPKNIGRTWLAAGLLALGLATTQAQITATWTGGGGDGFWDTAANWDAGIPAEGTNAVINGGSSVTYSNQMVATSFATLNLGGTLLVNTNGFNINPGSTATVPLTVNSGGNLTVNTNGVLTVANAGATAFSVGSLVTNAGTMIFTNAGAINFANGASPVNILTFNPSSVFVMTNSISTGGINLGASSSSQGAIMTLNGGTVTLDKLLTVAGTGSRLFVKGGTLNCLGGSRVNDTSTDGAQRIDISGGIANLGNFSVYRTTSAGGLVVANAIVNATGLQIGTGNSMAYATINSGAIVTNTGIFTISDTTNAAATNDRRSQFLIRGGTVVSTAASGIVLANQGNISTSVTIANANIGGVLDINAGSLTAEMITLIKDATITNAYARLNLAGTGIIYLGSGGLVANVGLSKTAFNIAITGGTLAAKADWASSAIAAMPLTGTLTVQAADAGGIAHNITLSNILSGSGAVLAKTGAGTLNLLATNTYTGNTLINGGTLALGVNGSIASSPQTSLASGSTFDVSAVTGGFTNASGKTLAGFGAVKGAITFATGATINPGNTTTNGALSFSNSVTEIGNGISGVINHFDLSSSPQGVGSNDFVYVAGDLNVTGTNTIQITAVGTLPSGTNYALIQYGGNFNGGLTNFVLSGAVGTLSNDAVNKIIYLTTQSTARGPTSTVWVGNPSNNNWDLGVTTNWLNGAALDIFVAGDSVRFNATGAANPTINVVGSVAPASMIVDSTANYAFTGAGSIDGSGGLTKTNTGTLTIQTVNSYAGVTTITGGKISAATLANSTVASSIGAAGNSPTNIIIDNGALEYVGGNVTIDRGITVGTNGATLGVTDATKTLTLGGLLTGPGVLTKTGNGQITLNGGNDYSGGTIINAGTIRANPAANIGTNILTLNGSTSAATFLFSGDSQVLSNPNIVGTNNFLTTAGNDTLGRLTGTGTVYLEQSGANQLLTLQAVDSTAFNGTFIADTLASIRFFPTSGTTLNASNAAFDLGSLTNIVINRDGGNYSMGALAGGPNTQVRGSANSGSAATTYTIGGKNIDSTFAGIIRTGTGGAGAKVNIVKVGTGTQTLSGVNTYNGTTVINGGTLALSGSGSISSSPTLSVFTNTVLNVSGRTDGALNLTSGQTLQGSGTVRGSVTAGSGSFLSVGDDANLPEAMVITNALTLQANATLNMDVDHYQYYAGLTNDVIKGLASVTYGGTLNLNVLSVETNSVFKLFSAGSYHGAFATITPSVPPLAPGWGWDTSQLTVDGTLRVAPLHLSISSIDTSTLSSGYITLNAINGTPGGTVSVLTTTNLALPLASWTVNTTTTLDGNGSLTGFTVTVDPTLPQLFISLQAQ